MGKIAVPIALYNIFSVKVFCSDSHKFVNNICQSAESTLGIKVCVVS